MGIYKINKNIVLLDGRSIQIDITIPFRGELDESSDYSFASDTLIKNIYDETKKAIEKYEASELPNKYINDQNLVICNNLPDNALGICDEYENIFLDADAMQNICYVNPSFLLSHEIGHKILRYLDYETTLEELAKVLGIPREYCPQFLVETFANACGNIVYPSNCYDFLGHSIEITEEQQEAIKRRTLYNIYHV